MALQLLMNTYSRSTIIKSLHYLKTTYTKTTNTCKPVTKTFGILKRTCATEASESIVNPLNVSGNVSKDTLIFKYANDAFFRNMTIFGFAQFVFWTYLMGFTYTNLRDVTPDEESKILGVDKESLPWWRKINLGGNMYRNGLASLCAIFGFSVLGISIAYPSRAVKTLHLLKGGRQVRIQTYSLLKSSKHFTTSLESISCLHARLDTKPQIAMKVRGKWLFFMLDKRGRFHRDDIFDYVIGLRRKF